MTNETENTEETTSNETTSARSFEPMKYVTFDVTDIKNRVQIFNAHNSALAFKNIEDNPINIVDVMAEPGTRARSNVTCQNTYLFSDDGNVYFTQSNGIAKTINELTEMVQGDYRKNTSNGYVTVQMQSVGLTGDRTYKQLRLIAA